ncbi:MAG TPA: dodecin family protein [Bellilinea sp.]|nr:dodecin family protein [Bellilinea sp.]
MSENVYKLIEIIGTSNESMEKAVQNAIVKAGETVKNMQWFEVTETRGRISSNLSVTWQVTIKVGFSVAE